MRRYYVPWGKRGKDIERDVLWLETASQKAYENMVYGFWREMKTRDTLPFNQFKELRIVLSNLITKFSKLDRIRLTKREKRTLAIIIFYEYPKLVAGLQSGIIVNPKTRKKAIKEYSKQVRWLATRYLDRMPTIASVDEEGAATLPTKRVSVRSKTGDAACDEKLQQVSALLDKALQFVDISVEDRFFVEQAANSYLPESVRLLSGMTAAPGNVKVEAYATFLRQLSMIEGQLNEIAARAATGSLSALQAHTAFLESKKDLLRITESKDH